MSNPLQKWNGSLPLLKAKSLTEKTLKNINIRVLFNRDQIHGRKMGKIIYGEGKDISIVKTNKYHN